MTLNERELFEKAQHGKIWDWVYFCEEKNAYRLKIVTVNEDKFRAVNELNYGWSMWQKAKAQAVPDGYCLVPKEPTEKMFQAYARYSVAPMSTLSKTGYKAMIEASESGAEG